tara:strand:+ start:270 stop:1070 length:801 start_codon:yes stop_codon:yes gene_type:complete
MATSFLDDEARKSLFLSGVHATSKNDDGSIFTVNIGNTIGAAKASGVSVQQVLLPQLFPNINQYRAGVMTINGVDYTLPLGQYTSTQYFAVLDALTPFDILFQTVSGPIFSEMTNNTGGDIILTMTEEIWAMWGYVVSDIAIEPDGRKSKTFTVGAHVGPNWADFGGDRLVHIVSERLARSNMINGGDGVLYDTLCTVPLVKTPLFQFIIYEPPYSDHSRINFDHTNPINSTLEFRLMDSRFRPLAYAKNHHIDLVLIVHHKEFSE